MSLFTTQNSSVSNNTLRRASMTSTSNTAVNNPLNGAVTKNPAPLLNFASVDANAALTYDVYSNGVVLFFAGVLADERNKYIVGHLQNKGFLVIVCDLFGGRENVPPSKDLRAQYETWAGENHERIKGYLANLVEDIHSKLGVLKYAFAVGSGLGSDVALHALNADPRILAGAVLHPDFNEISHFTSLDKPVLFTFTNSTDLLGREVRNWVETTLAGPTGVPRARYAIQVFATPEFGTGRNPKEENEDYAANEFARSASEWFLRVKALKEGPQ